MSWTRPVTFFGDRSGASLVLTCEHAAHRVPGQLGDLGLTQEQRLDHIGWDLGAGWVTEELSAILSAPAVLSSVSRLVVDCNRCLTDADLIPESSHGVAVPGNHRIAADERAHRLREYYHPYHEQVAQVLEQSPRALLLSVHSFTPDYDDRDFDIGVLFDDHTASAGQLASALEALGLRVRMNEPYSGLDGLIHSAQFHGRRAGVVYLEIEVNNGILHTEDAAREVARRIAPGVAAILSETTDEHG